MVLNHLFNDRLCIAKLGCLVTFLLFCQSSSEQQQSSGPRSYDRSRVYLIESKNSISPTIIIDSSATLEKHSDKKDYIVMRDPIEDDVKVSEIEKAQKELEKKSNFREVSVYKFKTKKIKGRIRQPAVRFRSPRMPIRQNIKSEAPDVLEQTIEQFEAFE
jgi:hypothetical protein